MSTTPEGLRALIKRHEAATDWRQDNLLQAREDCGVLLDLLRAIAKQDRSILAAFADGSRWECVCCGARSVDDLTDPDCLPDCPAPLLEALREAAP